MDRLTLRLDRPGKQHVSVTFAYVDSFKPADIGNFDTVLRDMFRDLVLAEQRPED